MAVTWQGIEPRIYDTLVRRSTSKPPSHHSMLEGVRVQPKKPGILSILYPKQIISSSLAFYGIAVVKKLLLKQICVKTVNPLDLILVL